MTAFVDANIIIYAVGRESPGRQPAADILHASAEKDRFLVTSAEVLQEVFHVLLRRGDLVQARFAVRLGAQNLEVATVSGDDILRAVAFPPMPGLQSRDLVHLATMARLGLTRIISTDRAFDGVAGIERLDPAAFATWHDTVFPA
jgi:predicted nucleic acid-binding protein